MDQPPPPLAYKPLERNAPLVQTRRNLPHWRQDGCLYFVTFRMADSLPKAVLDRWKAELEIWLTLHPKPWSSDEAKEYAQKFQGQVERWLDAGHGSCALRDASLREIVTTCLHHFDGHRYALDAYVVMPNHVHVLVAPAGEQKSTGGPPADSSSRSLSAILHTWKSFTSKAINRKRGTKGIFWMDESFDHAVRSEKQRQHFRTYIRENPAKAFLKAGDWSAWERTESSPECAE